MWNFLPHFLPACLLCLLIFHEGLLSELQDKDDERISLFHTAYKRCKKAVVKKQ
jgi:hypothetical protein